jgi:HSP90 family molecular chaperone
MKLISFQYKSMLSLFATCFLFATACSSDKAKAEQLRGIWQLTSATRNGQDAASLEKVFYHFTKDSVLTNFTLKGEDEQGTFKIQEDKLIQNTQSPIQYKIIHFDDTLMQLETELKGYEFKLILHKAPKTLL